MEERMQALVGSGFERIFQIGSVFRSSEELTFVEGYAAHMDWETGQSMIRNMCRYVAKKMVEDEYSSVHGVHAFCFVGDQLVIVYSDKKGYWTPPGGGVEPGETVEEAIVREVFEETNMRVLKQRVIGYQEVSEPHRLTVQVRAVCIVERQSDPLSQMPTPAMAKASPR